MLTRPVLLLAALTSLGCRAKERTSQEIARDELAWTMQQHFHDTYVAWESVLANDLARAQASGQRLVADVKVVLPDGTEAPPHNLGAALEAMAELHYAKDIPSAAHATARIGVACGSCHTTVRADVQLPKVEVPPAPDSSDLQAVMQHHRASTEAMWQALVMADDAALKAAATQLSKAQLAPSGTSADSPVSPEATQLEVQIHDIAARLSRSTDAESRATAFGDLLTTCASCHHLLKGGPGSKASVEGDAPAQ